MTEQWIYYVAIGGQGAIKINSPDLDEFVKGAGFRRCTYAEYLRVCKQLRKPGRKIKAVGVKKRGKGAAKR